MAASDITSITKKPELSKTVSPKPTHFAYLKIKEIHKFLKPKIYKYKLKASTQKDINKTMLING